MGKAVRFIVEADRVPGIVMHPWESMTTRSLLVALGAGRTPRRIPASVARGTVRTLSRAAQLRPGAQGLARRLEMLWFGLGLGVHVGTELGTGRVPDLGDPGVPGLGLLGLGHDGSPV